MHSLLGCTILPTTACRARSVDLASWMLLSCPSRCHKSVTSVLFRHPLRKLLIAFARPMAGTSGISSHSPATHGTLEPSPAPASAPYNASRRMMLHRAQSQLAAPARPHARMCAPRVHKVSKRSLVVTAAAQPEEPTSSSASAPPSLQAQLQTFVNKYETNALSSGVGALAVTGWCVAHGQDPATAAGISVMAVVVALVSVSCGCLFLHQNIGQHLWEGSCCRVYAAGCQAGDSRSDSLVDIVPAC
jgi:hypothetical protein